MTTTEDLPEGTQFVVTRNGRVRHVASDENEKGITWCNMIWGKSQLEPWDEEGEPELPICGACTRTLTAKTANERLGYTK